MQAEAIETREVIIVPFTSDRSRVYPIENWLRVEELLHAKQRTTTIIHDDADEIAMFRGEKFTETDPARIAVRMAAADAVIGIETIQMHLGRLMGAHTVLLCEPGERGKKFNPNALELWSSQSCLACFWQPRLRATCVNGCGKIANIQPELIANACTLPHAIEMKKRITRTQAG